MALSSILLSLALAAQPAPAEAPLTVISRHFYHQDAGDPQTPVRETTTIPYRPNASCYHWVIQVEPREGSATIRELFELPGPAEQWATGPGEAVAVSRDRASSATEFEAPLADGLITHGWCVAEGDPAGPHRIRVYHGDRLLGDFEFIVALETY